MSVKFHTLRMMKMAAVLPGGGETEICVFVDMQRGRTNMLWAHGDAGFIINRTEGTSGKTETGHFASCFQLCKDQEEFVAAGSLPVP